MSLSDVISGEYAKLEDEQLQEVIKRHNNILNQINKLDIENIPNDCTKAEYLYFQAQYYASMMMGYYKNRFKHYESMAEQAQADRYEEVVMNGFGNKEKGTGTDGQYLSRKAKGEMLDKASHYEGNFDRWRGIYNSYDNAINALKDQYKLLVATDKGGVA